MYEAFKEDPSELPPTLRLISLLLQGQVDDYEPAVLAQLYELIYSYISNVLQDAQLYADHAEHAQITAADVRLAIETRASIDFTLSPSKQALTNLAAKKNAIPLPLVQEKFGLRLPPERHLLIKQNVRIVPKKRSAQDEISVVPAVPVINSSSVANNDQDDDYDMDD